MLLEQNVELKKLRKRDKLMNIIKKIKNKIKPNNYIPIIHDFNNIPLLLLPIKEYLNEEIDYIYEIKRKLWNMKFKVGILSHSALLLHTINNNYFILEYGSGTDINRNSIFMYKVNIDNDEYVFEYVIINKYVWAKRKPNKIVIKKTIYDAYNIMNGIMSKRPYSLFRWNCHMAQQITRKKLGTKVPIKFEYTMILIIIYIIVLFISIIKNILKKI
jgi:hypothetical protein